MLIAVWSDVQQGIIDTAIDQWRKHLHSLGMCLCKWWIFGTSFVNKLLQTISIFKATPTIVEEAFIFYV